MPVLLGAAALTAALLLFPREGESPAPAGAEEVSLGMRGRAVPGREERCPGCAPRPRGWAWVGSQGARRTQGLPLETDAWPQLLP